MGCFHGIRSNDDVELWCGMIRYGVTGNFYAFTRYNLSEGMGEIGCGKIYVRTKYE